MKNYKISIPKPCLENWNVMKSNERGRFCKSCTKTVVDFTKKTPKEIQEYVVKYKSENICGHFYSTQLDSLVIQIPESVFKSSLSFHKTFMLILLIVMGTTLFSCKTEDKVQKIEKVELIESICKKDENTEAKMKIRAKKTSYNKKEKDSTPLPVIKGAIEVSGEVMLVEQPKNPYSIYEVDMPPKFKDTPKDTDENLRELLHKNLRDFVNKRFDLNITTNLGLLRGRKRIFSQITIDSLGSVSNIQIRAPHPKLKMHLKKILEELPLFVPAEKDGESVATKCIFPITFEVF
ncbi:energy transducer TonB [Tenacibaculum amylolyticum]|uniref:hypothetical protein n=1 Tax=Tenacibaculum amylolyticum TaxID=104269 RepID=UPI0038B68707